jgi:hypothetical protein
VACGDACESKAFRKGLLALPNSDQFIESWLQTEVDAAYDEL